MVHGQAQLPGIVKPATDHLGGCLVQVEGVVENGRTFAAQLQCHRSQMPRGGSHNSFAYSRATGEEHVVER
ncbi:hypothetical protein D3C76_1830190 [compost metagenome]